MGIGPLKQSGGLEKFSNNNHKSKHEETKKEEDPKLYT